MMNFPAMLMAAGGQIATNASHEMEMLYIWRVATLEAKIIIILLVPLVGFDMTGRRLGMGGGYYDATLAALRAGAAGILAVGYAFAVQQVPELPAGSWDQRLDWIVTERAAIACADGKQD